MKKQIPELRTFPQQPQQNSISEKIGNFVPMPNGMQALQRDVIAVIRRFSSVASPADERRSQTLPHLLRLLIQDLLRHLLPKKAQVVLRWNHAQPDRTTRRKQQRARIVVVALRLQKFLNRLMSQIARGENMRQRDTCLLAGFPTLGQVCFDERSMPPA